VVTDELIEKFNAMAASQQAFLDYHTGHHNVFMRDFKNFIDAHVQQAQRYEDAFKSFASLTQIYMEESFTSYINEVRKLKELLSHNLLTHEDFNHIKSSQAKLKLVANNLEYIIKTENNEQLLDDAKALLVEINAIFPSVDLFFKEREEINVKRADLISKTIEYQQLKQKTQPAQKKSPQNSSSATSSTTQPSTLLLWRNVNVHYLVTQCVDELSKTLAPFMQKKSI
jgi:hypothetical protein